MPELKNTFSGGKMEKDLDERIVPSGQYREALNISVSTSEGSDVGAAQNILGNIKVTEAIAGPKKDYVGCTILPNAENRYNGTNKHITHVVDPQSDKLYRFIATTPTLGEEGNNHGVWMDRIVEYDTNAKIETGWQEKEKAVMVDVYKVETVITSLDIISPPPPPPDPEPPRGEILGCIDPLAPNYDPLATVDGCYLAPQYCCNGVIDQCTNKIDLIPPGEDPNTYYYPFTPNDSSIPEIIEKIPAHYATNQALYRYPTAGNWVGGCGCEPGNRYYNAMWGIAIIDDAVDNNGTAIPFATQAYASNVSGLLYGAHHTVLNIGNFMFNAMFFHCPEDFITYMNTIPDSNGNAIGGFTTDHTLQWAVPGGTGGQDMAQGVVSNIFGYANVYGWVDPGAVSSVSMGDSTSSLIRGISRSTPCCTGDCVNLYTQGF